MTFQNLDVLEFVKRLYMAFKNFYLKIKAEDNANFVYIIHLLAKLCNIFDEAFLLTSVYMIDTMIKFKHYLFYFNYTKISSNVYVRS